MTDHRWNDDAALLSDLAAAIRDQPPESVVASGEAAFAWRTLDSELAELLTDDVPAGIRGPDIPRTITFRSGPVTIEVEIAGNALRGQLVPAQPARIEVEGGLGPGDAGATDADADGFFAFTSLPATSFRLAVTLPRATVRTPWIDDPAG